MFEIQSVRPPKSWTEQRIINWLYKHQIKPMKHIDKNFPNFYRIRITDPKQYKKFYTKILKDNVELIIGIKK